MSSPYREAGADVRASFEPGSGYDAQQYYAAYRAFVADVKGEARGKRLLELGCGVGASSRLLSLDGFDVTGTDLDNKSFRHSATESLRYVAASATQIPFADGSFDIVTSYQMLEHIREPGDALSEMVRVCARGGVIIVAGPNLLSPLNALRGVVSGPLRRNPGAPRYPSGNSRFESAMIFFWCSSRLLGRCFGHFEFLFREPDFTPPSRGDSDACFYLNPLDIAHDLQGRGCRIIRNGLPGRAKWTAPLAGGTWIAAVKP